MDRPEAGRSQTKWNLFYGGSSRPIQRGVTTNQAIVVISMNHLHWSRVIVASRNKIEGTIAPSRTTHDTH